MDNLYLCVYFKHPQSNMKKFIVMALAAMLFAGTTLSAQTSNMPQRNEIVQVEIDPNCIPSEYLEVFDAPVDGAHHYYLSVGHLGLGDEVVQVLFDPIFELFIPLGDNVTEALETLQTMQALFKENRDTSIEVQGCLAVGFPTDKLETVKVTYRKVLLSKMLEFSVEREGYIRATHIAKSDFGSAVSGVKTYHKIHPKQ